MNKRNHLNLLLEAYRRWITFGQELKPLGDMWLGLGYNREYKDLVMDEYFKWINKDIHQPRCQG